MGHSLLILGAGQYGAVVHEIAEALGMFEKIGFLDDNNLIALGKLADFEHFRKDYDCAAVAIGNPMVRLDWVERLVKVGYSLPPIIHPRAYVSSSAKLGMAVIVEAMAVVNTGAVVEAGGLLCAGCVVNHNAHILPVCQIDCNAVVASNATVPRGTKVPGGAVFDAK